MRVIPIEPRGFCAGVVRALKMADEVLSAGQPVYCIHEIVHNEIVVRSLKERGMRFVDSVEDVPVGAKVLFSAHGVSPQVRSSAEVRKLKVMDATCPFVTRAHETIRENFARGMRTVVIGDPGHAEVIGYLGEPGACLQSDVAEGERVGKVVQTTLDCGEQEGVCTATRERQNAVAGFSGDAVLVLGGAKSSNTRKLVEKALNTGKRAWRAGSVEEIAAIDFSGVRTLGVTSGASTPETFFAEAVSWLNQNAGQAGD